MTKIYSLYIYLQALSLTRLQLSGANSLFLSVILPLSALLNLLQKSFSFKKTFSSVSLPWHATGVCVLMRGWVCVCVHSCCMHWILTIRICKECVSALGLSGLGALSIHSYSYWQVQAQGLVKKKGVGGGGSWGREQNGGPGQNPT